MNPVKRTKFGDQQMIVEDLDKKYLSLISAISGGKEECFELFDSLSELCKQRIVSFLDHKDLFRCRLASKSLKVLSDRALREKKKRVTINRYWSYEKISSVINLYNRATTLYIVSVFCDTDTSSRDLNNSCGSSLALKEGEAKNPGVSSDTCEPLSRSRMPLSFDEISKLCVGKVGISPVTTANSPTDNTAKGLSLSESVTELVIDHDYNASNSNFYMHTMNVVNAVRDCFKNLKQIALCGPYNDIDIRRIFALYGETLRAFHLICAGRNNRSEPTEIIVQSLQRGVIAKTEVDFHGEIAFRNLGSCRKLRGLTLDNVVNVMRCFYAIPDDAAKRLINLRLVCAQEATADEQISRIKSSLDLVAIARKCCNLRELTIGSLKYINFAAGLLQIPCLNRVELVLRCDPRDDIPSREVDANENSSSDESDSDEDNDSDDDYSAVCYLTESDTCSDSSTSDSFDDYSFSAEEEFVDGKHDERINGDEPLLNNDEDNEQINCKNENGVDDLNGEVGAQLPIQVNNHIANVIPNQLINQHNDDIEIEEENEHADDVEVEDQEQFLYGETIFVDNCKGEIDDIFAVATTKIENIYFTAQNAKSCLLRRSLEKVLLEYMFSICTGTNLSPKDALIRNEFSQRLAVGIQKVRIKYDLCGEKPIVTKRLVRLLAMKLHERQRARSMPILQLDAFVGYDNVGEMKDWYDKFATLLDYAASYFTRGVVCNLHVARDAYAKGIVRKSEVDYVLLSVQGTNKKSLATEAYRHLEGFVKRKIFGHIKFEVFHRQFNF